MSQILVDYILELPGQVDEFLQQYEDWELPVHILAEAMNCRKQDMPRYPIASRSHLYKLIAEVYPDRQANKEAYAKQELAKGKSVTEVANAMRLDRKTIQRWKKKWKAAEDEAASA